MRNGPQVPKKKGEKMKHFISVCTLMFWLVTANAFPANGVVGTSKGTMVLDAPLTNFLWAFRDPSTVIFVVACLSLAFTLGHFLPQWLRRLLQAIDHRFHHHDDSPSKVLSG